VSVITNEVRKERMAAVLIKVLKDLQAELLKHGIQFLYNPTGNSFKAIITSASYKLVKQALVDREDLLPYIGYYGLVGSTDTDNCKARLCTKDMALSVEQIAEELSLVSAVVSPRTPVSKAPVPPVVPPIAAVSSPAPVPVVPVAIAPIVVPTGVIEAIESAWLATMGIQDDPDFKGFDELVALISREQSRLESMDRKLGDLKRFLGILNSTIGVKK
jgi:hypothetical protein